MKLETDKEEKKGNKIILTTFLVLVLSFGGIEYRCWCWAGFR